MADEPMNVADVREEHNDVRQGSVSLHIPAQRRAGGGTGAHSHSGHRQLGEGRTGVSFTRDELSTAIDNFQKLANHDLNVDYDHACEDLERAAGEPTPSAGTNLALDEPEEFRDTGIGSRESE